jgi:hypothetical protein
MYTQVYIVKMSIQQFISHFNFRALVDPIICAAATNSDCKAIVPRILQNEPAYSLAIPSYSSVGFESVVSNLSRLPFLRKLSLVRLDLAHHDGHLDTLVSWLRRPTADARMRAKSPHVAPDARIYFPKGPMVEVAAPALCCLECLDISGCELGAAGLVKFAHALATNRSLLHLNLSATGIGGYRELGEFKPDPAGMQALAVALRGNRHLASLDLSDNQIGGFWSRDGCLHEDLRCLEALAQGLQGHSGGSMLQTLNLSGCHIQVGGAEVLARMFCSSHVRLGHLMLDRNNIGGYTNYCGHSEDPNTATIVTTLATALAQNRYLHCCSTTRNNLSKEIQDRLSETLSAAKRSAAGLAKTWCCRWCMRR